MTYFDAINAATERALDEWSDLPDHLLPLVITSEAEYLSGQKGGPLWEPGWR